MASPEPLQPFRRVQSKLDAETRQILERTAKAIRARIGRLGENIGGQVRAAQLRLVLAEIDRLLSGMWTSELVGAVQAGRKAASEAAESAAEALTRVAYNALPDAVAEALVDGLRATAASGIESDFARVPRELSARVYKRSAIDKGHVERTIREGLQSGLSARELARDVYKYVSPTTPGGASYAAMRLARTEINNAFHERQKAGANRPGVMSVNWNLSDSHKVPDACNVYAARSPFRVDQVPDKPHPHCFCYLTYNTMQSAEFAKALANGDFDDELDRRTKANLARLGATPPAGQPSLADRWKSGVASSRNLGGGDMSRTELVTLKDGSKVVKKRDLGYGGTPKDSQDAEELAVIVARGVGFRTPDVLRLSTDTIVVDFVEGQTAFDRWGPFAERDSADLRRFLGTANGRRMALLDIAISNADRNVGNFLIDENGDIEGIDHGAAFQVRDYVDSTAAEYDWLIGANLGVKLLIGEGGSFDFSRKDVQDLIKAIRAARPEFARLRRLSWYNQAIVRLAQLGRIARGTGRLFA